MSKTAFTHDSINDQDESPYPDRWCPACEHEEATITPPSTSVLPLVFPVHRPSGMVCVKYMPPEMYDALKKAGRSWSCDCVDGVSEAANYQREKKKREDDERDESFSQLARDAMRQISATQECPSCYIHPHLDPCCDNCAETRTFINKGAAIIERVFADNQTDAAEICAEMAREAVIIADRHNSNYLESADVTDSNLRGHYLAQRDALREAERRIRARLLPVEEKS